MKSRVFPIAFVLAALAAVSGCSDEPVETPAEVLTKDPLLARALNDPLMVDPDLSLRNEAISVFAYRDGHPLPPVAASEDASARAREAARLELLEGGPIPPLPPSSSSGGSVALGNLAFAEEMIAAVGSRTDCLDRLEDSLIWSTRMPDTSAIMPHGMVQQAAGVDVDTCVIRIVRYLTPASIDDVLEYHFTKIDRARFQIELFDGPEKQMRAERRDQALAVHVRQGPGGMTAVDVIHWRK